MYIQGQCKDFGELFSVVTTLPSGKPGIFLHIQNVWKEGYHMVYDFYIFKEYQIPHICLDQVSKEYF